MKFLGKSGLATLAVMLPLSSLCQSNPIDSLKRTLPRLTDTAKLQCLSSISLQLVCKGMDSAEYFTNLLCEESKKSNFAPGAAAGYTLKSILSVRQHDVSQGEQMARQALLQYDRTPDKRNIEYSYLWLGKALFFQHRYDEGAPYLDQSFSWAEKHGNIEVMRNVQGTKYESYRDIGEYDKAFQAFQKNQELNILVDGKKDMWYEHYVLAELQRRLGNYQVALEHYRNVIAAFKDLQHENIWFRVSYPELFALNGKFDSAQYYFNLIDSFQLNEHDMRFYQVSLGEFYLLQNKYREALNNFLSGLSSHREAQDVAQINRALIDLARTYTALQDDGKALVYAHEGLDLSLRSHAKQYIRDAYEILYNIYQRSNKPDSAFAYYKKYVAQKEIVENDVVKGRFATYNYDQQIQLLQKEAQLRQQQLKQTSQQRKFLLVGIAGMLILGIFLIRNILLKRKNEANRRIMAENELLLQKFENEKTKAELEQQATELEMQALRAQMNPHFIFNSLNSINRFILQNNKAQASEYLTKFSKLVRMILQNSQAPSISLENEIDALKLYLDLEAVRFENHFDYKISVSNDMDTEILKVPPLIIQPFAENAIWHGLMHKEEKGHLEIDIVQEDHHLLFTIADDGIGREKAAELASKSATRHKSMGLKITTERIAMLQKLSGSESPVTVNDLVHPDGTAAGTQVVIKLPVLY